MIHNFYLFDLKGLNVVFGYDWLEGLVKLEVDFKERVILVTMEGKNMVIGGDL